MTHACGRDNRMQKKVAVTRRGAFKGGGIWKYNGRRERIKDPDREFYAIKLDF
jgi:hypothetical protein